MGCFLGRQGFGGATNAASTTNGAPPKEAGHDSRTPAAAVAALGGVSNVPAGKTPPNNNINIINGTGKNAAAFAGGGGGSIASTPPGGVALELYPGVSPPIDTTARSDGGMRKNSSALTLTSTTPDASSDSTSSSTRHKTDTAASSSPSGRNAEPPRDKSSKLAAVQVLAALVQQAKNEPYVQPKLREEVPTPFPSPSPALEAKDTRKVKRWRDAEGNKIVNEYVIIRTLGSGSYGKVKLCINTENNEFYALKICHKGILKRRRSGLSSALQVPWCTTAVYCALLRVSNRLEVHRMCYTRLPS